MKIYQVDSFTKEPFKGNPAGVCILDKPADETWMQNVALEMNLSETAFLYELENGFNLRWFTPTVEVDLCGHATLASAHILWVKGILNFEEEAKFYTKSGQLTAKKKGDLIEMNFPSDLPVEIEVNKKITEALNIKSVYFGKGKFDYIIEISSEDELLKINPNFSALKELTERGVIVTAKSSSPKYDFISRFFAPAAGINEDPVTGSAHCCVGPYWGNKLNKNKLIGYQASKRGGIVSVELKDDRVVLGGNAVTVLEAELFSNP